METVEEFYVKKIKELTPFKEVVTLSQELITAEQAMRWAHEFAEKYKTKADKWDKLDEKIGKFYDEDNPEYFDEMGLVSIGEICVSELGYL